MCWSCVVEEGGDLIEVTDEMKEVAGLIWDWYQYDENAVGGALHVQLDDHNLDDHFLGDDWCDHRWLSNYNYTSEVKALGNQIVQRLRNMTQAERQRTVHEARPYGGMRP